MNIEKMKIAVEQAKKAIEFDEIPVGCAIFRGDELISCGYNRKETLNDATLHAEIVAISEACKKISNWRLDDCAIYITLEPCMMCMGAIIESRIKTVYYGTKNNNEQMYDNNRIKSLISIENLNDVECSKLLSDFFKKKRKK